MDGMTLSSGDDVFSLRHSSSRLKNKLKIMPMAKMAQKMLCHRVGIINEGEHIMEEAIKKFTVLFRGRLPSIMADALRALFHLDCDLVTSNKDALIAHGGSDTLEHSSITVDGVNGCTSSYL
ncbi:hypothetical protein D1007_35060 [Hordeum vulgare]|nr:hypothetical protein D1007_35060 [Hordeum vulgare]